MNSEADFVAAIAASPDDKLLRGAFADWLEEQADPRAAWIRADHYLLRHYMGPTFQNPIPKMVEQLKRKQRAMEVRRIASLVGAPCVPALVELLAHEDNEVRLQSLQCLRKIGRPAAEAVPALLEALKDESASIRAQAAKAIKEIRPKKGSTDTDNLRAALSDPSWSVRHQAAGILGSLGAKQEVLDQVAGQLDDQDPALRLAAVEALGNLRSKAAIAPLCRALADKDGRVVARAAAWLRGQVEPGMSDVVAPLQAALKHRSQEVRQSVITALGNAGAVAAEATPELLKFLRDGAVPIRIAAATSLGFVAAGDDQALPALEAALADEDVNVAVAAAVALGRWQRMPPRFAGPLLALDQRLTGNQAWRRGEVLAAMGALERPTPEVLNRLGAVLTPGIYWHGNTGPYAAIRRLGVAAISLLPAVLTLAQGVNEAATVTLGYLGEQGVARLLDLTGDDNEYVRIHAVTGLRAAGEAAAAALPHLLRIIRADSDVNDYRAVWQKRAAILTLRAIGPAAQAAIPDLLEMLRGSGWGDQTEAAGTLAHFGEAVVPHLDAIAALLRDRSAHWQRARAARLLAALAAFTPDVLEPLREAVRSAIPNPKHEYPQKAANEATRRAALEGLATLRDGALPAVPEVLTLLDDPVEDVRREAAVVLGKVRAKAAVAALGQALRTDPHEGVRARAAEALGLIGERASVEEFLRALRKEESARVRREAATALGRLKVKDDAVIAWLRAALDDADKAVKAQAAAALKKIEGKK